MISELKILNGELELKFDKYTYEYTVRVDNNIDKLEFEYILDEDVSIDIRNNYLDKENNIVYLDVYDVFNTTTYTFYVYKENTNLSVGIDNYKKSLETNNYDKYYKYKLDGLIIICFFIILIIFSLLFKKKRNI